MRHLTVLALAAALAAPAGLRAQSAEAYRQAQMDMLRHQRRVILAMADSMPVNLYGEKMTPIQRSFAQQLTHAAGAVALIMGRLHGVEPTLPDTIAAQTTRAGMHAFVNAVYDQAEAWLAAETEAQRNEPKSLFGATYPLWRWWDEVHMHASWTTGQVVANFRKNGMAPPAFSFF